MITRERERERERENAEEKMEGCYRKWLGGTPVCCELPIRLCFTCGDSYQSFSLLVNNKFMRQRAYVEILSAREV